MQQTLKLEGACNHLCEGLKEGEYNKFGTFHHQLPSQPSILCSNWLSPEPNYR